MVLANWTIADWMILIGGVLLLIGLQMAFISLGRAARLRGPARKEYLKRAPEPASPQEVENSPVWDQADVPFRCGLWLIAAGVILQTVGALAAGIHY
jgi:hypothetical protein